MYDMTRLVHRERSLGLVRSALEREAQYNSWHESANFYGQYARTH